MIELEKNKLYRTKNGTIIKITSVIKVAWGIYAEDEDGNIITYSDINDQYIISFDVDDDGMTIKDYYGDDKDYPEYFV